MLDHQEVLKIIERIRPQYQIDGHDLELVEITDDNIVRVKLCGHCEGGCSGTKIILGLQVQNSLKKKIPAIKKVEVVSRAQCVEQR